MTVFTASSEDTRVYEICVLIGYPLSQKEEQQVQKAVEELLAEAGGKQLSKEVWGQRGLAYTIGGFDEGNYILYYYELEPDKIKELDENMRITPGVLRHLIVKPPKDYEVVKFADAYDTWQKERVQEEEAKEREKEERLRQKVIRRQKMKTKQTEQKKDEVKEVEKEEAKPVEEGKLNAEIDKLIADDEIQL